MLHLRIFFIHLKSIVHPSLLLLWVPWCPSLSCWCEVLYTELSPLRWKLEMVSIFLHLKLPWKTSIMFPFLPRITVTCCPYILANIHSCVPKQLPLACRLCFSSYMMKPMKHILSVSWKMLSCFASCCFLNLKTFFQKFTMAILFFILFYSAIILKLLGLCKLLFVTLHIFISSCQGLNLAR